MTARQPRILFASYHGYLDTSSGAALATRTLLELLAADGWDCRVLCGPRLDFVRAPALESLLADQEIAYEVARPEGDRGVPCTLIRCQVKGVTVHLADFPGAAPAEPPNPLITNHFLQLLRGRLQQQKPDLLLTWGGDAVGQGILAAAQRAGVPSVFWLHNCEYRDARYFEPTSAILVPSHYVQQHYWHHLQLDCTPLPPPIDWQRVLSTDNERRYVTFINPIPHKGAALAARIAQVLGQRRPEIPFLVVEGRAGMEFFERTGVSLQGLTNLNVLDHTPDPRDFYAVTRILLVPSFWQEAFGMVAAEALINAIPVLASRRGGLPEVLASAGFLFDLPECFTPTSGVVPTAADAEPWVRTIERLVDDPGLYAREQERCRRAAEAWKPERVRAQYQEFFRQVLARSAGSPGTPLP